MVWMLSVTEFPLVLVKFTGLVLGAHAAADGSPEHEIVMPDVNNGRGVNCTVYVAVAPATGMLWLLGLTTMLKSVICAGTDVCASTMLPGPIACTVPPLKNTGEVPLRFAVGVAVIVSVAVDPDCSEIGPQLMLGFVEPLPLHVPAPFRVPETLLSCALVVDALKSAVTTMLLARSGPLFVTV